jgi:hypothetical protein
MAPISAGELVDKITILTIKSQRLSNKARDNALRELGELKALAMTLGISLSDSSYQQLLAVNSMLWEIEDEIRSHESRGVFGESFIQIARSVYTNNDRRAAIKRAINLSQGSEIIEEKLYTSYGLAGAGHDISSNDTSSNDTSSNDTSSNDTSCHDARFDTSLDTSFDAGQG